MQPFVFKWLRIVLQLFCYYILTYFETLNCEIEKELLTITKLLIVAYMVMDLANNNLCWDNRMTEYELQKVSTLLIQQNHDLFANWKINN